MPKKFKVKPGRVDYTNIRYAPVINCVVRYRGKILIVERSKELNFYPGYWNGISGFLDDTRSLTKKVQDELREELGIPKKNIRKITFGQIYHVDASKYKKTWIVHPILVDVTNSAVKLDWEAHAYRWIVPRDAKKFKLLPDFLNVLQKLSLIR